MPLDNKYLAKMRALNGGSGGTSTPTWDNILNKPDVVLSVNGITPDAAGNVEVQGGGVTSWNDLTDKPFGEEVTSAPLELTYGGSDTSVPVYGGMYAKLSDAVPTMEALLAGTMTINNDGTENTVPVSELSDSIIVQGSLIAIGQVALIVAETVSDEGLTLEPGVYAVVSSSLYMSALSLPAVSVTKTLDPKYIKDMYYEEEGGVTTILDETSITCANGNPGVLETVLPLEDGKTYTTVWNGVSFESPCVGVTDDGEEMYAIGNVAALGIGTMGADCPFVIASFPTEGGTAVFALEGDGTYTCSIIGSGTTIHKIDNKYIDAEWMAKPVVTENVELIPESTAKSWMSTPLATNGDTLLTLGETYKVVCDGVTYNCVFKKSAGVGLYWYLGNGGGSINGSSFTGEADTGEPFRIYMMNPETGYEPNLYGNVEDDNVEHTIAVYCDVLTYPELPEKYLPDSVKGGGGNLVVNAIINEDGQTCTADKTFAEISAAIAAGAMPVVRLDVGAENIFSYLALTQTVGENVLVFGQASYGYDGTQNVVQMHLVSFLADGTVGYEVITI